MCKNLEIHKNSLSSSGNTNCYSLRIFRNVNCNVNVMILKYNERYSEESMTSFIFLLHNS